MMEVPYIGRQLLLLQSPKVERKAQAFPPLIASEKIFDSLLTGHCTQSSTLNGGEEEGTCVECYFCRRLFVGPPPQHTVTQTMRERTNPPHTARTWLVF